MPDHSYLVKVNVSFPIIILVFVFIDLFSFCKAGFGEVVTRAMGDVIEIQIELLGDGRSNRPSSAR